MAIALCPAGRPPQKRLSSIGNTTTLLPPWTSVSSDENEKAWFGSTLSRISAWRAAAMAGRLIQSKRPRSCPRTNTRNSASRTRGSRASATPSTSLTSPSRGTALASTKDFQSFARHGIIFCPENKDVVLFPEKIGSEYYALHRPNGATPFTRPEMWLPQASDPLRWGRHVPFLWGHTRW